MSPRQKQKTKAEAPDDYGSGILELCDYSNRLRYDWREVFSSLSENKKLGVRAHVAFLKAFERARAEVDRAQLGYLGAYNDQVKARLKEWKERWGHIPGWWNWF